MGLGPMPQYLTLVILLSNGQFFSQPQSKALVSFSFFSFLKKWTSHTHTQTHILLKYARLDLQVILISALADSPTSTCII